MAEANGGPPAAAETEAVVLATTLRGWVELQDPSLFDREPHRRICAAAVRVHNRGGPTGWETLVDELTASGEIDQVGGSDYVAGLFDRADPIGHAARLEELQERARRRELHQIGRSIQLSASSPETGLFEITSAARERLDGFDRVAAAGSCRLIDDVALEELPKPEQLIDGVIPEGGLVVPFGPPGSGKTFIALDMALAIASGFRWQGRMCRKAPVVLVSAEGSAGLGPRVAAWKHARNFHGRAGLYVLRQPVNLMDPAEVGRFISGDLRSLNESPSLVIFDTLARCMIGGDENSAEDMGLAVAAADRVRTDTGAAVMLIHHTNKGGDLERGSTALRGAADTMMSVKDEDGLITLRCEKQKDSDPFSPFRLRLARTLDSCTIEGANAPIAPSADELTPAQRQVMGELHRLALRGEGLTATQWEDMSEAPRRTFYFARKALYENGYVESDREGRGARYTLTEKGLEAMEGAKVQVSATDGANDAGDRGSAKAPPERGPARRTDGTATPNPTLHLLEDDEDES